jgi:hypothetical protein
MEASEAGRKEKPLKTQSIGDERWGVLLIPRGNHIRYVCGIMRATR